MPTTKHCEHDLSIEVTVLSAHSLKNPTCFLIPGRRLRPFVTLSTSNHTYRTRIDETGAHNPQWNDTITIPISPDFLTPHIHTFNLKKTAIRLRVMSKRFYGGTDELGWCNIRADDVIDGMKPPSKWRRLSYALRAPSRGCGVVDLEVRVVGRDVDRRAERLRRAEPAPEPGWRRLAIGIPVGLSPEGMVAAAAAAAPEPAWECDGASWGRGR